MTTSTVSRKPGRWLESRTLRETIGRVITYILLCSWGGLLIIPLFWMVSTSLKVRGAEFLYPPQWIPKPFEWSNYPVALTLADFHIFFKNTMIIVLVRLVGVLITASMAGYSFARLRYPARDKLFALVLSTMMLPSIVTLVPQYLMFNAIGWIDSLRPLTVPFLFGGGAFNIFLLRQFFLTIPVELEDAAKIDGAGFLRIYGQIMLPLAKPALGAVGIFTFVGAWNEFTAPLIYLQSEEVKTLALGLYAFRGAYMTRWNLLMAASTTMVIPVLIVFFSAQRVFIQGIAITGFGGR